MRNNEICFVDVRFKSDFIILISYLEKVGVIKLEYGDDLLKQTIDFVEEVSENSVTESTVSRVYSFVHYGKNSSEKHKRILEVLKDFIEQNQCK